MPNFLEYIKNVTTLKNLKEIPPESLINEARHLLSHQGDFDYNVLEASEETREAFSFLFRCYIGELYKGGRNVLNKDIVPETASWLNQLSNITQDSSPTDSELLNITAFAGNYRRDFEHYMGANILRFYPGVTAEQIAKSLYFIPLVKEFNSENSTDPYSLPSYLTLSGGNTSFTQLDGRIANKLEDFLSVTNLMMPTLEEFAKIRSAIGGSALTNDFFLTPQFFSVLEMLKRDAIGPWQCGTEVGIKYTNNSIIDSDHNDQITILRLSDQNLTIGKQFFHNPKIIHEIAKYLYEEKKGKPYPTIEYNNWCSGSVLIPSSKPTESPAPTPELTSSSPTKSPIPAPSSSPSDAPSLAPKEQNTQRPTRLSSLAPSTLTVQQPSLKPTSETIEQRTPSLSPREIGLIGGASAVLFAILAFAAKFISNKIKKVRIEPESGLQMVENPALKEESSSEAPPSLTVTTKPSARPSSPRIECTHRAHTSQL